jgi:hypothetical protein
MKKVLALAVILTFAFAVNNAVARELSVAGSTTVQVMRLNLQPV